MEKRTFKTVDEVFKFYIPGYAKEMMPDDPREIGKWLAEKLLGKFRGAIRARGEGPYL